MSPAYWTVTHRRTGKVSRYKTSRAAHRAADRMDLAYGAIIATIRPHYPENVE